MIKNLIFGLCIFFLGLVHGQAVSLNTPISKQVPVSESKSLASWKMQLAQKIITKIQSKIAKKQAKKIKNGKQTKGFKMKWGWFWFWGILLPLAFFILMIAAFAGSNLSNIGIFFTLSLIFLFLLVIIPLIVSIVKKDWDIFISALIGYLSFYFASLIIALLVALVAA